MAKCESSESNFLTDELTKRGYTEVVEKVEPELGANAVDARAQSRTASAYSRR